MSRMLRILLILCVTAAYAAVAQPKKNPDVERAVKAELVGKNFVTKKLVGSYMACPESPRGDALRMVDTELLPDGSLKFYARANCFFPGGMSFGAAKGYVPYFTLTGSIQPGTSVWIRGVDFREDRVEVRLSTNNTDSAAGSGKIKYMVGAGYQAWSAEDLMEVISRGILIPSYEKLAQLKAEYEALLVNLQDAEQKYNSSRAAAASKPGSNAIERDTLKQVVPLKKVAPVYPPIAKAARVQGMVVLDVLVGKDGSVESATVVSGPPLLRQAAIDAVNQWKYRPSLVNGAAVEFEVEPKVEILFTLGETPNPSLKQDTAAQGALSDAIALRAVLEKLQHNRAEFMVMGKSDPQAGVYSEKLKALVPEIARLSEEVHKERVAYVRDQLQEQLQQLSQIQSQVRQKPPTSLAEWQQRIDLLATYSSFLDSRQKLLDGMRNENESPSPEDLKFMNNCRTEIATAKSTLEQSHQQIELADLTSQYIQLTKRRAQLLDAYSRAFGTSRERAALQDLISVLDEMVSNREQATGLGDTAATAQLIKCRADVERFRKK